MAIWRQPPRAQQPKGGLASLLPPQYYRALTIDHTLVPNTDQTDFPVLISLTHANLKTITNGGHVANSSGFDILFFSDSNLTSPLAHEIEKYDPTTGEIIMWVKVATVSHTTDTTFYMKYGDGAIGSSQENVAGVWSNSFAGVWHLGSASSLNSVNSVTGGSGSISGATAAGGKISGAGNFAGATDKIVADLTTNSVQRTYTVWARRHGEGGGGHGRIFQKGTTGSRDTLFVESPSAANTYEFLSNHNPGFGDWAFPKPSIDVFHYIVLAYDASSNTNDPTARVDKIDQTITRVAAPTGSPNGGSEAYNIGNRLTNDRNWDGDIDEFRIADVIRSSDWHDTEYNNQNSPSAFILLGTEIAIGASEVTLVIQNAAHSHSAQSLTLTQVHSLAVQNAAHAQTANNLALTQAHQLVVSSTSHAHTAQNLSLTQVHSLAVQNASHSHTAASLTLTQAHSLTTQNATHSHTAGNLALTQAHSLVVQDASHAHAAANITLTQAHSLVVQSATHAHTAESPAVSSSTGLVIQDATHAHTSQSLTLTQVHSLAVQGVTHSHSVQNVVLTQAHSLVVQDASHAHTAQSPALTQVHNLTIAGASHAHSAENLVLVAQGSLGIENASHSHTAQSLIFTQVHNLAVQDAAHAHTAQNISLIVDLAIQSTQHAHLAGNVTPTQAHALSVQDASHAHTTENVAFTQTHILTVQDASHAHVSQSLVLGQVHVLAINTGQHAHSADTLALTQVQNLVIANSFHAHTADRIHFRAGGRVTSPTRYATITSNEPQVGVRSSTYTSATIKHGR